MNLLFSLLSKSHDRKGFSCGNTALDTYLQKQARQDAQRGFSTVIVATEEENPERIIGYYTLAAASVALDSTSGGNTKDTSPVSGHSLHPAGEACRFQRISATTYRFSACF